MKPRTILAGMALALTAACVNGTETAAVTPAMRWDHRPEASTWTQRTLVAVAGEDDELAELVPADIKTFCPGYETATMAERRAFWVGLLSATAKHESTWNPRASGGGGRYLGLMQISPATARQYGCEAQSASALKDGTANLACAVQIMAVQVGRDKMVAGGGTKGIGRDWGPFRSSSKRADIAKWTASQSYCKAGA
ncbi:MAG: transglycosylase SLT domain-containing protein [Paracoccaceae bacterium]